MGKQLPVDLAPDTRVVISRYRSMTLPEVIDAYEREQVPWSTWEHVAREHLSGVIWWVDLEIDSAVVVKGQLAVRAAFPWGNADGGWIMDGDGSRARTVGEAVAWGAGWLAGAKLEK